MTAKEHLTGLFVSCIMLTICSCGNDRSRTEETHFTKADSLTDTYLNLRDSMLLTWNAMIHDDNLKIRAMRNLFHELEVSTTTQKEQLESFEERLDRLKLSRYTQSSMRNTHVIEEYDFASNSLVTELIALAEAQPQYSYNSTMQKLVANIRAAEESIVIYRNEYDRIAGRYNEFVERNRRLLTDIDDEGEMEKRPLFQMTSEK